ncbi:MAG: Hsp20/alpha crystallin family protein [Candidatus Spechtbacterales bacterium]
MAEENKSFFEKLGNSLHLEDQDDETVVSEHPIERRDYLSQEQVPGDDVPQERPMAPESEPAPAEPEPEMPAPAEEPEESPAQEEPAATATLTGATTTRRRPAAKTAPAKKAAQAEGRLTVDVYETAREIIVKSTVAGVAQENLEIDVTADSVSIRGVREKDEKISTDSYFYQECYWGAFSRSILLPTEIDPDKAKATLKNGILTIRMPKLSRSEERRLKIQAD